MKVPVKTLQQFANIQKTPEEIVKALQEHIGEVESFHNLEEDYTNIVIAEIKKKEDHPDADKLGVYQISIGEGENIQVLAGDKTLEIGEKVAYLKPGAVVPYTIYTEEKPFVIQTIKMRGLESNGMMGSEKELNLGSNHTHVMRLPKNAPVGKSFAKYYELDDTIIEIENKALTNRGDLFGIIGIARELSVVFGLPFKSPDWYFDKLNDLQPRNSCLPIEIINDAEILCNRYTAIIMENTCIEESPVWLKSALTKFGYKTINNIVDITNYISHITGQPLHAFDYDKLVKNDPNSGGTAHINIRMAKEGENILGLDNKVHTLNDRILVIADNTNPIAIAGIIGGKETEVDENTKRIVLECANFDKTNIRRTSMALGISTEAATKFKHALDTELCIPILKYTANIIEEISQGVIASSITDIYIQPTEVKNITIDIKKLNNHLGTNLEEKVVEEILTNLEYKVLEKKDGYIIVNPPSWRKDINIKEDIHEDIGRIYGYNNIERILPKRDVKPTKNDNIFQTKKEIRDILSNNGANETDSYSFLDSNILVKANLNPDLAYRIKNAQAPELSLMRTSLIPSLLIKMQENIQRGFEKFILYEFNIPHIKDDLENDNLPKEAWHLSLVLTNQAEKQNTGSSYFLAKHYLEKILGKLFVKDIRYELIADYSQKELEKDIMNSIYMFNPNTSALILHQDEIIGVVGELESKVKENFKLPIYTAALDLNINKLVLIEKAKNKYIEMPKYPESSLDITIKVAIEIQYQLLEDTIMQTINSNDLWGNTECLDIYQGKEDTEKKITLRLHIRNFEKTLTPSDNKNILEKVTKKLEQVCSAKVV